MLSKLAQQFLYHFPKLQPKIIGTFSPKSRNVSGQGMSVGLLNQKIWPVRHLHLVQLKHIPIGVTASQFLLQELIHLKLLRNRAHLPESNFFETDHTPERILDGQVKSVVVDCNRFALHHTEIIMRIEFVQLTLLNFNRGLREGIILR